MNIVSYIYSQGVRVGNTSVPCVAPELMSAFHGTCNKSVFQDSEFLGVGLPE